MKLVETEMTIRSECNYLCFIASQAFEDAKEIANSNQSLDTDPYISQEPIYGFCDTILFTLYQIQTSDRELIKLSNQTSQFIVSDNVKFGFDTQDINILLPQLVAVYTTQQANKQRSFIEACIDSIAATSYLASMDIFNFPVFALATYQTFCGVIMAWKGKNGVCDF